jgi:hypothetical protein
MKLTLKRIDVAQAAKINAILWAGMGVLMIPVTLLRIGTKMNINAEMSLILISLVVYPIVGCVCGGFLAAVYNKAAEWTGGLRFTCEQDKEEVEQMLPGDPVNPPPEV